MERIITARNEMECLARGIKLKEEDFNDNNSFEWYKACMRMKDKFRFKDAEHTYKYPKNRKLIKLEGLI